MKGQRQRILDDLLQGLRINWLENIQRYGTSCRSRIAELRANGYQIEDCWEQSPSGARYKIYYIPERFLAEYHTEKVSA